MRVFLCFAWLLYFLQGIPYGFQTKFLPVFLRSHSLSLSLISFTRLLSLPWILKPLWAPLVDRFGSKASWIIFNLLGMALFYLFASFITLNHLLLTVAVVAGLNLLAATQDIAVDSIIVDVLSTDDIGFGNIAQVVGYKSGSLVGGGLLGWLSSSYPWERLFFLLFLTYFLSVVLVFLPFFSLLVTPRVTKSKVLNRPERKGRETVDPAGNERKPCRDKPGKHDVKFNVVETYFNIYRNILKSPGTKWTIAYVVAYKLGEQGVIAIYPMSLMDQGLHPSQTAVLTGVWCQLCSIIGSLLGGMVISPMHWRSLRTTLTALSTVRLLVAGILTWIGSWNALEDNWLSIVFLDCALHFVSGAITTVSFTLMVYCSQQCPANISATHYSTLATFEVLGKLIMISMSGSLVERIGYNKFFLICFLLLLCPIVLLGFPCDFTNERTKAKV